MKAYDHHWKALQNFINSLGLKVQLPINCNHLALFITHLHEKRLKYATIRNYLSGIAYIHKMLNVPDPTSSFLVKTVMAGIPQNLNSESKLLPITKDILEHLLLLIPSATNDPYDITLYRSLFLLSFHACLRVGEAVTSSNDKHTLKLSNLNIEENHCEINFTTYKHSKNNTPSLKLRRGNVAHICPLVALKEYLNLRGHQQGQLYLHSDGSPIKRIDLLKLLNRCLMMGGYPVHRFNCHSFRIGRATQLARERADVETIKATGRWKSSAYVSYIREKSFTLPL